MVRWQVLADFTINDQNRDFNGTLAGMELLARSVRALPLMPPLVHVESIAQYHGGSLRHCAQPTLDPSVQPHHAVALHYALPVLSMDRALCAAGPNTTDAGYKAAQTEHWRAGCGELDAPMRSGSTSISDAAGACWIHPGPHTHRLYALLIAVHLLRGLSEAAAAVAEAVTKAVAVQSADQSGESAAVSGRAACSHDGYGGRGHGELAHAPRGDRSGVYGVVPPPQAEPDKRAEVAPLTPNLGEYEACLHFLTKLDVTADSSGCTPWEHAGPSASAAPHSGETMGATARTAAGRRLGEVVSHAAAAVELLNATGFRCYEDRPKKPGYIANRQGSTLEISALLTITGHVCVGYLRSYDMGMGRARVAINGKFGSGVVLDGHWELPNSQIDTVAIPVTKLAGLAGGALLSKQRGARPFRVGLQTMDDAKFKLMWLGTC